MAEFLLRAQQQIDVPNDTEKASRLRSPGDIVCVMPDGHPWGKEERLPKFWVVKIPGVSVDVVKKFEAAHHIDTGLFDAELRPIMKMAKKSRFHLDISLLPTAVMNMLNNNGVITVTASAARNYLRDKLLGSVTF
jgi:hypothetical protein